ncbi:MAG: methionine adenosyltransferase [Ignavibacteria bacterium GWB2_35_12]|nr:MAG: methionine adenosyltransferase [Ignavibacteria bacterium GWB2_35_12]OGU92626.1 MAG: methionine adenosyltransferase [Ignavibacteria bacterium RIFOXYA2_FULL_35_10]OGV24856.1 MAG: methionine adenosyltransferase [Ignavibacteria bacterium RIFOXYC2_FULL_35_21]
MGNNKTYLFTSESVSEGHPDKICDQISDAVLDAMLAKDPFSRVACECFVATGMVIIGGEIKTKTYVDLHRLARNVIAEIGYNKAEYRFDAESCSVINVINPQSPDISQGVDKGGAGDQGMMFGYACNETPEYMPAPIMYAHKIVKKLADIRKNQPKLMPYLRPDSKSQVTVEYSDKNEILRIHTIVISTQHDPGVEQKKIREDLIEHVVKKVFPKKLIDDKTVYHVNPTGSFVIGGPHGDTGLTGRKIIVDTYGGRAPHGGGCFSGKDPTKVDRSGAYAARHLAKNIVAAGITNECTIQLSYAIGVRKPISIFVNLHGSKTIGRSELEKFIIKNVDLTPDGIIKKFDLRRPIYRQTAVYGHFGKQNLPWEQLDLVNLFKKMI